MGMQDFSSATWRAVPRRVQQEVSPTNAGTVEMRDSRTTSTRRKVKENML